MFQLNVRKQSAVHQSVMNDEGLKDFDILAISEPHAWMMERRVMTSPMSHSKWTRIVPTIQSNRGRWPIRSMLWVRKDIEAEQISIASADLTAAVLRLPGRSVLVVSVYVKGQDEEALLDTTRHIRDVVQLVQRRMGPRMDVILAGDFNRHDQLWGGENVLPERQGEADPIVDLMSDHSLHSLLPRGTSTWQNRRHESTIDLVLVSDELASAVIQCGVYTTEHGSDHRAIETVLDVANPNHFVIDRLLFKNAPWKAIKQKVATTLYQMPVNGSVQAQTDRLMSAVLDAVHSLTPRAKPSPYAKRWWTKDLTQLRRAYTYWRNLARSQRRAGYGAEHSEEQAHRAAKEYHDGIRRQRKKHWDDFLSDNSNIWTAARYLQGGESSAWDKIPPLVRADRTATSDTSEQAKELLATFFPPLPVRIADEGSRHVRTPLAMPPLTIEEVERCVFAAKPWKAPGDDGLPAMVWRQVWPVVKGRVLLLFQTSLDTGQIPSQWRNAKIIPLKKPNKADYTVAKAWRPISLLSTLGKVLEAVVADRLSYMTETHGLLPTNHFGARKGRSAEQALILLQEHVYNAWRSKQVLSLVSFDVKGAYNGVYKERLLQRLAARGIPAALARWIDGFCSERTAKIVVNGQVSEQEDLPQAGLPQGSPLSPILFLFFNADLVQRKIDRSGGAVAFVDDYTAWVTGPTAAENRRSIQTIADQAIEWEERSGATFEGDKTAFVHFTRNASLTDTNALYVKGEAVLPRESARILGVTVDAQLRYKQHAANAASKGLSAAMALKRLRMLSPSTARQLFEATVAPAMDYASSVWAHSCGTVMMAALNRAQRIGAQAVVSCFRTVSTAVAEAEASLRSVRQRHMSRASRLWISLRTLPHTHPLSRLGKRILRKFRSPLQKIALSHQDYELDLMETIRPFAIEPWAARIETVIEQDPVKAMGQASRVRGIRIAIGSSVRNGIVGMGAAIHDTCEYEVDRQHVSHSTTVGRRTDHNPYTAELASIAEAVRRLTPEPRGRGIVFFTSNQGAVRAVSMPKKQSGQEMLGRIYDVSKVLRRLGNRIKIMWIPAGCDFSLLRDAKAAARRATEPGRDATGRVATAKSTTLRRILSSQAKNDKWPEGIGRYSRRMDVALPGPHTRKLYDMLSRKESSALAQLRTGMSRLNSYLHRIGAAESEQCMCGRAEESVEHFLFRCSVWDTQRRGMLERTDAGRGNLSTCLGGKHAADSNKWKPDLEAVKATVQFAMATGRLDTSTMNDREPSGSQHYLTNQSD